MTSPSTLQYLETITTSDGLFATLQGVDMADDCYCSGNFGTVFKIATQSGLYELKCFTRAQHGRLSAYRQIS